MLWGKKPLDLVFIEPERLTKLLKKYFIIDIDQGSWPPQSIEIDQRPDKKSDKALLGPLPQQGEGRTSNMFPCLLTPRGGQTDSLHGGEGRGVSRGWAGRVAQVVCPPLCGVVCRGMCSTLPLLQTPYFCSLLFRSGSWAFWVFLYLLSRICPNCTCMQLFLVPYSFFVLCSLRRGVSRCKHCSTAAKGPRSQACLIPSERLYTLILKG